LTSALAVAGADLTWLSIAWYWAGERGFSGCPAALAELTAAACGRAAKTTVCAFAAKPLVALGAGCVTASAVPASKPVMSRITLQYRFENNVQVLSITSSPSNFSRRENSLRRENATLRSLEANPGR
jgi:hypothetical protein